MPGSIERNAVVRRFGTPDVTEGSVNEPREREDGGMRFNEKWIYHHPRRDPAGAVARVIYWRRYDFVGTQIRRQPGGEWSLDDTFAGALGGGTPDAGVQA
jgi:hypothetical protein